MERLAQVIIPSTNKLMYVQAKDQTNEPTPFLRVRAVDSST